MRSIAGNTDPHAGREAETRALLARVRAGDRQAEAVLVREYRWLVSWCLGRLAARWQGSLLTADDLVQEGLIGILTAGRKFDPGRGVAFSTYAEKWIRQAIRLAIANQRRLIRIPVATADAALRASRARDRLRERLGREPASAEVAAEVGDGGLWGKPSTAAQVERLLGLPEDAVSLDAPVRTKEGEYVPRGEAYPADDDTEAEALGNLEREAKRAAVLAALAELPERERLVVVARYLGEEPRSLRDAAGRAGLSTEGVRLAEKRALPRLKAAMAGLAGRTGEVTAPRAPSPGGSRRRRR